MGVMLWGFKMSKLSTQFAIFGLLVATSIWGSTFFIIKDAVDSIHPVTLVAYRFGLAALIFACIVFFTKEKHWVHAKQGFILGLFVWGIYISQTVGLQFTTASNSGFITGLFILFVPIFAYLFFRRKPGWLQLFALFVALVGLWFLTGGLTSINLGDLLTVITAIVVALDVLFIDKFVKEKRSVAVLNFQQCLTTSVLSFATMIVLGLSFQIDISQTLFPIVYLAVFGSVIAQGLQLLCQKHLKTLTATLLLSTEPIFAAIFAWTLGNELFVAQNAVGGLFIVLAIFITELPVRHKKWST